MKSYTMKKVQGIPNWSEHAVLPMDTLLWTDFTDVTAQAQVCYDNENFYLRLEAVEPHIRMENKDTDLLAEVCEDSCLEFFLQPTAREAYFNLEINPNGAIYFGYGRNLPTLVRLIVENVQELLDIKVEFTQDGWVLTYRVPFAFIRQFFPEFNPTKGGKIRANFYKCGDETVKAHYLAWNPVPVEPCTFHIPEGFGCLIFGE